MKRWTEDVVFFALVVAACAASGAIAYIIASRIIEAVRGL